MENTKNDPLTKLLLY